MRFCDPPFFPFVRYIEQYGGRGIGRRFYAMSLVGDVGEGRDVHSGRLRKTGIGAWIEQWWHWFRTPSDRFDMQLTIQKLTVGTSVNWKI